MSIVITAWDYLYEKNFDEQAFEHRDSRLMDKQTKITVSMARNLYAKVKGEELKSEEIGIVFLSNTGPTESIAEYHSALKEKGYIGVNPSKFPNIMAATSLSRVAIEIKAKGPCVPLLSSKGHKHALMYAFEQITVGRCVAMLLIHISKDNNCFGCFIEDEFALHKRSINPRLIYNLKR